MVRKTQTIQRILITNKLSDTVSFKHLKESTGILWGCTCHSKVLKMMVLPPKVKIKHKLKKAHYTSWLECCLFIYIVFLHVANFLEIQAVEMSAFVRCNGAGF